MVKTKAGNHTGLIWTSCAEETSGPKLRYCGTSARNFLYFGTLDVACQNDFQQVMAAMAQRFGTMVSAEAVRGKMDALRQKSDQSLEDLSQEVRRLAYYVFADDPPARREAEAVRCFIKAISQKEIVTALVNATSLTTMAEALDLAIRTRDRHLAFLPKPKLLVRQVVS